MHDARVCARAAAGSCVDVQWVLREVFVVLLRGSVGTLAVPRIGDGTRTRTRTRTSPRNHGPAPRAQRRPEHAHGVWDGVKPNLKRHAHANAGAKGSTQLSGREHRGGVWTGSRGGGGGASGGARLQSVRRLEAAPYHGGELRSHTHCVGLAQGCGVVDARAGRALAKTRAHYGRPCTTECTRRCGATHPCL